MKRIEMSDVERESRREKLMARWTKTVLCHKPSKQSIRNTKNAIASMRQDRRNIVKDQDIYIEETLKQDKEMREYKKS
jgi:hypothetical protein